MITERDLQAVVDLVLEADGKKAIRVKVEVRNIDRGWGGVVSKALEWQHPEYYRKFKDYRGFVLVPKRTLGIAEDYAIYYAIHELAHVITGLFAPHQAVHGTVFKKTEDRLLKHWELAIGRKKVYPRTITSRGEIVYTSKNPILCL